MPTSWVTFHICWTLLQPTITVHAPRADAGDVVEMLEALFADPESAAQTGSYGSFVIPSSNRIMLVASPLITAQIRRLLSPHPAEDEDPNRKVVVVYLHRLDATRLGRHPSVIPDEPTNSMILIGAPGFLVAARSWIELLDNLAAGVTPTDKSMN